MAEARIRLKMPWQVDDARSLGAKVVEPLALEAAMHATIENPKPSAVIRTDLGAIFVSLELSRSIWVITSWSPGCGEKMSKHQVPAGDLTGLFARFTQLQERSWKRCGHNSPIVVIQEAGLDGFWIHRARILRAMWWTQPQSQHHVEVGGPKQIVSTVKFWSEPCWPTNALRAHPRKG